MAPYKNEFYKDVGIIANSLDPDQSAPSGAVWLNMSLIIRKPVFGVFDQVRLKPACAATEGS